MTFYREWRNGHLGGLDAQKGNLGLDAQKGNLGESNRRVDNMRRFVNHPLRTENSPGLVSQRLQLGITELFQLTEGRANRLNSIRPVLDQTLKAQSEMRRER